MKLKIWKLSYWKKETTSCWHGYENNYGSEVEICEVKNISWAVPNAYTP